MGLSFNDGTDCYQRAAKKAYWLAPRLLSEVIGGQAGQEFRRKRTAGLFDFARTSTLARPANNISVQGQRTTKDGGKPR